MRFFRPTMTVLTFGLFLLISCQDDARNNQNMEILETDEIETNIGEGGETENREGDYGGVYSSILEDPDLTTFAEGLEVSEMGQAFVRDEPYTVFAPSNTAFDQVSQEDMQKLKDPNLKEQNRNLWEYYMVDGNMTADYFSKKLEVGGGPWNITTLQGEGIKAFYEGDKLMLEDARGNRAEVERSIETDDGVVHITSQVLSPSGGLTGSEVEVNSEVKTDKQY